MNLSLKYMSDLIIFKSKKFMVTLSKFHSKPSILIITIISMLFINTNGVSKTKASSKAEKINALITNYTDYSKFKGSILVAQKGQVIFKKGYGMANVEWDILNQTDTRFRIASITKQFTAMLIMQLVAENKLDLHVPISTYLPDYPKNNADRITLHHLLTHTSGTPRLDDFVNYRDIERDRHKPKELLNIFKDGELNFTPGAKYSYVNTGYVVLGIIIEKVTGKPYAKILQEKIFKPLNMQNSGYDVNYEIIKKRASGYTNNYLRGEYINVNYVDMSVPYAAGSIYSTVEDLFIWDQALYTEKLLPKKYMDQIFTKHAPTPRRSYGYGWFVGDMQIGNSNEKIEITTHGGGINGFRTGITRVPSSQSSIIILSNLEGTPVNEITNSILGILHDKPYNLKKSVAYSLVDVIAKEGIERGLEYYKEIKNLNGHYTEVNEMNIAGYELLHADKINQAAFLFKLNLEAFPNSFIPYDSYAEVLLILGHKSQAIENYKKSIVLNPNNRNAIRIVKELEGKQ